MSEEKSHSCREIITLNIGGFGINIGTSTLEQYCVEQGISINGEKECKTQYDHSIHTSFREQSNGKYVARSLFFDLLPYSINMLQNVFKYNNVINQNYLINGLSGSSTIYSRGHYTTGKEHINRFTNTLRLMVEECDSVGGFIINNSLSGGTGGGFGALALERVAVDYRKKAKIGFHAMLDDTKSITPLEIINALITMHWLMDHTETSIIFDNVQLYDICKNKLNIKTPRYKHYNSLCNKLISNITAPWRFGMREDMNVFARDMVPYPRLHYLTTSMTPVVEKHVIFKDTLLALTDQCCKSSHFFHRCSDFEPLEDRYMALKFNYRGNDIDKCMDDINKCMKYIGEKKLIYWMDWCADKPCVNYINDKITELKSDDIYCGDKQVTMVGNNTCISRLFTERITKKYDLMYSQRAYVHWHVGEGMSEGECPEAREDLGFLEKDYMDVLIDYYSDSDEED